MDKIRNTKIRQSFSLNYTVIDKITQKGMRLFEHIKRLSQDRYPKLPCGGQTGKQIEDQKIDGLHG